MTPKHPTRAELRRLASECPLRPRYQPPPPRLDPELAASRAAGRALRRRGRFARWRIGGMGEIPSGALVALLARRGP